MNNIARMKPEQRPPCPWCGFPVAPEHSVADEHGRRFHDECYRFRFSCKPENDHV